MISSISSSSRGRIEALLALLACLICLAGCSAGEQALRHEPQEAVAGYRIAVLPVDNLSKSGAVQAKRLRQSLSRMLEEEGFALLEEERLTQFMARHRVRHVGGIDSPTAKALLEETGSNAVLITNLELYEESDPPKIALFCRLVSTGSEPQIIWMDAAGMAGDDAPGVLDLGMIHDHAVLQERALSRLVDSLVSQLSGAGEQQGAASAKRFGPRLSFDASFLGRGKRYTIGVLPFINLSQRNYAGEIMALQFVRQLSTQKGFVVLEPGLIRERLLASRIIMFEGISKYDLDILSNSLGTDLMVAGKVNYYADAGLGTGSPHVEFSTLMLEGGEKKIVWSSTSYNHGDDSVFFFDAGRLSTAQETSAKMVRSLFAQVKWNKEPPKTHMPGDVIQMERFKGYEK